ncbi:hybrid-cluster NAD(P)-dependent oxidoreductase [Pseudomonas sp. 148P]|uniref:Hybrid-cluster NAD(P)-dependent oxidoreductase n=1 Tax=Pseudomonas ulcerans TaxID=3115852 RepID=A0ABU7HRQ5_9PSED|nr:MULTISPECIES: hybrid-cluster NAD(P)-dependent oxidoreductase [unclassified Pseudomonas]MEE1922118.1 hybrid-cluster NAD(P)-dependent oxidoreductase [Pseudomonas sp. 147P]MEE1934222.1 hybrid-cluster NAD(P)-dependent oxidoreductase [Pseudomonas sp. 148P]
MSMYENIASLRADQRFADTDHWTAHGAQWASGDSKRIECLSVVAETHDVKTFTFHSPDYPALAYEPGQFLTVSPQIDGQSVSRCYTLSSTPTRPFTFSITVKRVPGGVVSNWLHDNLKAGDAMAASGPAGIFTPVAGPARKLLYLSAGSGITPLMAMTRAAADLHADLDIVFVHSARTPKDIIFRDELARLERSMPRLRTLFFCEGTGDEPDWKGPIGRLSIDELQQRIPDFMERSVFTCGPKGYMDAAKSLLGSAGFDLTRYHQESFDISAEAVLEPVRTTDPGLAQDVFTVRLARSGKEFTMSADQTVLSAAKKAGAVVPSSCSQGVCGTCKTAVLEGSVDMSHNGGIRQREIDKGLRLLCCSRPTSNLVIDL